MTTLAIETSCDETAAAVLDSEGNVLASKSATQNGLHRAYGRVLPQALPSSAWQPLPAAPLAQVAFLDPSSS